MARSKSDVSNSAIRIFLQDVGRFYDKARGYDPFVPNVGQKNELLTYFDHCCCYCGEGINKSSISLDHLIPMNKKALGLHAWGNVVACCQRCNNEKQQKAWELFLASKCQGTLLKARKNKILSFILSKNYDPKIDLHRFADNLYEDVGEVVMTLIRLRYKQAEEEINKHLA